MHYRVNDIYACIQGEGALCGTPMVLIRLQGCGVGCPWCDTKETWALDGAHKVPFLGDALGTNPRWATADAEHVASMAHAMATTDGRSIGWVLVTGGEPADQHLKPLVDALHARGLKVALETSGTALGHLGAGFDWVCVSPKPYMPRGKMVQAAALRAADEIKMVVGKRQDIVILDALLSLPDATGGPDRLVCLQPLAGSEKALALCLETAKARGWRLSIQIHKLINER